MEHIVVYAEPGHFAGWPANNGIWLWDGLEILVGFTVGDFKEQKGHNILEPYRSLLARSRDGGQTWAVERPTNYVGHHQAVSLLTEPLDLPILIEQFVSWERAITVIRQTGAAFFIPRIAASIGKAHFPSRG
jgi:hypothetical protein